MSPGRDADLGATSGTRHVPAADSLGSFRLDGRVALVTGTSSGLGRRFAQVLDAAGASVLLASRRGDRNVGLASELTDALAVTCDIRRGEDREGAGRTGAHRRRPLDMLLVTRRSSMPAEVKRTAAAIGIAIAL